MDIERLKQLAGIPPGRTATPDEVRRYRDEVNGEFPLWKSMPHPDDENLPKEPTKPIPNVEIGSDIIFVDPNNRASYESGKVIGKDKYFTYIKTKRGNTIPIHHQDVGLEIGDLIRNKYGYKNLERDRFEKDPQSSFDFYKKGFV